MCRLILTAASSSRLVCYFNSLSVDRMEDGKFMISNIDPNQCTHLIFAFADITSNNSLAPSRAMDPQLYSSFNQLKTRFSTMTSTPENRKMFTDSAVTLLTEFQFDGLNLDWRFPGADNKQAFSLLAKDLQAAFAAEMNPTDRLILTASVSAEREVIAASYEVAELAELLDFINVLTFDFRRPQKSITAHHSPLHRGSQDTGDSTEDAMQYWVSEGAPAWKLNVGLATFGRAFTLSSPATSVGAPALGPGEEGCYTGEEGFWAYYEICLYIKGGSIHNITDQSVPFAVTENQWVGFDDKQSFEAKVVISSNGFGGALVWSLDLDDFTGKFCNSGKFPLISFLNRLLLQGPSDACIGKNGGVVANPADETTFFNCGVDGQIFLQHCVVGLVFRQSCDCCDHPVPRLG
uniref:chitinase n=1 Tax=Echeneis naucrates TaxID=173247 RepID=A0A665TMT2_ECHNA